MNMTCIWHDKNIQKRKGYKNSTTNSQKKKGYKKKIAK